MVTNRDCCGDATTHGKVSDDNHLLGGAYGYQVIENLIGDLFIEDAAVAEAYEVVLQRLKLEAEGVWDVSDPDFAKIWQSGFWA